jgi:hypothetical protein
MFDLALSADCLPLDLSALQPAASAFVYEFRDADGNPDGDRSRTEFEIFEDGSVGVHRIRERDGQRGPRLFQTRIRFGFFAELPAFPDHGLSWNYTYDTAALAGLASLAAGETIEIPASSIMYHNGRPTRVDDTHRVTHQGCKTVAIMGSEMLVHSLRFDVFNQTLDRRSGEPRTRRSTIVREYSVDHGWWVAERNPGGRSMVLVDTAA